jgi:hypothetical protein
MLVFMSQKVHNIDAYSSALGGCLSYGVSGDDLAAFDHIPSQVVNVYIQMKSPNVFTMPWL